MDILNSRMNSIMRENSQFLLDFLSCRHGGRHFLHRLEDGILRDSLSYHMLDARTVKPAVPLSLFQRECIGMLQAALFRDLAAGHE